jgi:hypothetical protein
MRRPAFAVFLLCVLPAVAAAQGTFSLERKAADTNQVPAVRMGTRLAGRQPGPTQGVTGVPAEAAKANMFFALPVGGSMRWAVSLPGETPSLLVDTDDDKDFSDETPRPGKAEGSSVDFGTFDLGLADGAKATVRLMGNAEKPGDPPRYMILMPGAYCTGTVTLGGKPYTAALVDGNMNGRFNDAFDGTYQPQDMDGLCIDLDGNGSFDMPRLGGPSETTPLAGCVGVGGTFYKIAIEADGSKITLTPFEPGFGTLDVGADGAEMVAFSDYGIYQGTVGADGTLRLPAGRYAVIRLGTKKKDQVGEEWQLMMTEPPEALNPLEVRQGQTHRVPLGPPLTAEVDVEQRERLVRLNLMLKGAAGERYTPGAIKGRSRTPPPEFDILSEAGKVLETGKFEYG